MSKLLQVIGVLAILGFTGAGFGAWMLTKEQVHITVEEGAGDRLSSVDPTAELADRFTALQGDLRGLGQTLGKNFELLDTAAEMCIRDSSNTLRRVESSSTNTISRALIPAPLGSPPRTAARRRNARLRWTRARPARRHHALWRSPSPARGRDRSPPRGASW